MFPTGMPARVRLRLTPRAEARLRAGHPWVFADGVREQNREGEPGELAVVYDRRDRFLAAGLYDPGSPIRLRVLVAGRPAEIDGAWWLGRFGAAVERRRQWFPEGGAGPRTDGYRVVNGESDGFPGLVLDRYGTTGVVKLYSAAWGPWLETLTGLVRACLPEVTAVVQRASRNAQPLQDGVVLSGEPPQDGRAGFIENGLAFEAEVLRGQKTGFFLDQRENRARVRDLAAGRDVLNVFSYSGAFSVYAAAGGARSVTDLDSSPYALQEGERNFARNRQRAGVATCRREAVRADAFPWLTEAVRGGRRWGLVVIDPPALAQRAADRDGALRVYRRLAESGLELLGRDGWLVVASCSSRVSREDFVESVTGAARASGRLIEQTAVFEHAPDHPASIPEAHYLKAVFLHARQAPAMRTARAAGSSGGYPARRRRTPRKNNRSGDSPSR